MARGCAEQPEARAQAGEHDGMTHQRMLRGVRASDVRAAWLYCQELWSRNSVGHLTVIQEVFPEWFRGMLRGDGPVYVAGESG
jgi:hypothetical protein